MIHQARLTVLCLVLLLGMVLVTVGPTARTRCAHGEDEQAPTCDLPAVRFETDARLLAIYDGLRRGLEKAHLPRVCLEDLADNDAELEAFARGLERRAQTLKAQGSPAPVAFAFGDGASERLVKRATTVPRVFVLNRYSLDGRPLAPLPEPEGPSAVVYAEMRVERIAEIVKQMLEDERPTVALAATKFDAKSRAALAKITRATGLHFVPMGDTAAKPRALLYLRLGIGAELVTFRDAVRAARKGKLPLVSDDPARYRLGLVPVVVATHAELVGRYAAEAARLLVRYPEERLEPRAVVATRVLVDLKAADAQGLSLPLPFLATAFELTRGLPQTSGGGKR